MTSIQLSVAGTFISAALTTNALAGADATGDLRDPGSFPVDQTRLVFGAYTSQPIGHYEFCKKYREECQPLQRGVARTILTPAMMETIRRINSSVNSRISPETDMNIYGVEENWIYPVEKGDCEDFALQKRRELHEAGIPLENMPLTVVRKSDGEGHAILTILARYENGAIVDLLLDNLQPEPTLFRDSSYQFLKRQASSHAGKWIEGVYKPYEHRQAGTAPQPRT